jgi:hypothetical protein
LQIATTYIFVVATSTNNEFSDFCRTIHTNGEGYVFEDMSGFMVKLKSPSYLFWKMMRWVLWAMQGGKPYGGYHCDKDWIPEYISALKGMCKMKAEGTLKKASILDVRLAARKRKQDS